MQVGHQSCVALVINRTIKRDRLPPVEQVRELLHFAAHDGPVQATSEPSIVSKANACSRLMGYRNGVPVLGGFDQSGFRFLPECASRGAQPGTRSRIGVAEHSLIKNLDELNDFMLGS
jgi:hypothetical protein